MAADEQNVKVASFFEKALEDQVEFSLMFLLDMCQFASVRAPCVSIKNRHFILRAPMRSLANTRIIWGADVDGYFNIRLDDLVTVHFRSRLARIYNAPPDSLFLVCPIPAHIDHGQRRNSRRVDLNPQNASGFGVWYGALEGGNEFELPQQNWHSFSEADCQLGELSASGMRLDFASDNPLITQIKLDTPVLLRGDFGNKSSPMPLFILGAVVRKMPRLDREGMISLGCHFNSWRKVQGSGGNIRWFKADEQEGIAIVSRWLMHNFKGTSSMRSGD